MPKQVRTHMTSLDRGLAISARKEGLSVYQIAEAFHRDPRTIRNILRKKCQTRLITQATTLPTRAELNASQSLST